jgi:hypothetical protein
MLLDAIFSQAIVVGAHRRFSGVQMYYYALFTSDDVGAPAF